MPEYISRHIDRLLTDWKCDFHARIGSLYAMIDIRARQEEITNHNIYGV